MALIEVAFNNGRLVCQGVMRHEGQVHSASDRWIVERAGVVELDIESGMLTDDDGEHEVEPGVYRVTRDGLSALVDLDEPQAH